MELLFCSNFVVALELVYIDFAVMTWFTETRNYISLVWLKMLSKIAYRDFYILERALD